MTTYTSLLKKTGQTTSYVTGDDGDLEKGVANSFAVLDTGQYSGTTTITLESADDVHSNNCVQDNVTGLMWMLERGGYVGVDQGKGRTRLFPWTTDGDGIGIWTYLAAANAASFAGHNDWRIPNAAELLSIIDFETGYFNSAFGSSISGCWSSTTVSSITTSAIFSGVSSLAYDAKTTLALVILVRGSPSATTPCPTDLDFEINGLLDVTVYLQKIRDGILGVNPKTPGLLTWEIYLQEIRDAILLMYP